MPAPEHALQEGDLVIAGSRGVAIGPATGPALDDGLGWLWGSGSRELLVWSAAPNPEADLRLLSRGLRDSFRPRWMWRGLHDPLPAPRLGAAVEIGIATERDRVAIHSTMDVPYLAPAQTPAIFDLVAPSGTPRRTWLVLARHHERNGMTRIAGAGAAYLSEHEGTIIGGMYNLGVAPDWRGKGIGTALTCALCGIARDEGACAVVLNATPDGERIYRQLDFVVAGDGQTWHGPASLAHDHPAADVVARAEALARGDLAGMDVRVARLPQMPNGESPGRFAARFGQVAAVRWLLAAGAPPDVAALWFLGLRAEAVQAAGDARWRNAQLGPESLTPLHEAIQRNDEPLVRMLVAAGADLAIRDTQWQGRPLDWANALGRPHLAAIIERAM